MDINEYVKQVGIKSDSYEETIQAIIAFDSAIRYDDVLKDYIRYSYFLPGRRFSKSVTNEEKITPDVAIQLTDKYGVVGEVKITASTDQDFAKAEEQITRYDNDLIGWKTKDEKISTHDISLLVHDFHKGKAKRYFDAKNFQRKFSIIACARTYDYQIFFKVEKHHGVFSDVRLEQKFMDPIGVPMQTPGIVSLMSTLKFYDVEPPVEYMMSVLWLNIFNEIAIQEKTEAEKMITVSCKQLTDMLAVRYSSGQIDSRQPKVPRESWVRNALEVFSQIDYAYKDLTDGDKYHIRYSHFKKEDIKDFFARKYYEVQNKPKRKKDNGNQLEFKDIIDKK